MNIQEANKKAWLAKDKTVYGDDPLLEVVWAIEDLTNDEAIRDRIYDHLERVKRFREALTLNPNTSKE